MLSRCVFFTLCVFLASTAVSGQSCLSTIAKDNPLFLEVVEAAGFTAALNDPTANVTVLIPTVAPIKLIIDIFYGGVKADFLKDLGLVTEIVKQHVLAQRAHFRQLREGVKWDTANGPNSRCKHGFVTVTGRSVDGGLTKGTLSKVNMKAKGCKMIAHVIDDVLFPCSVTTPAGRFSGSGE